MARKLYENVFQNFLLPHPPPNHRPRWVPFHVMDLKSNFVRIFAPHPHSGGPKNLAQNGKWRESWTKSDQTHRNRTVEQ